MRYIIYLFVAVFPIIFIACGEGNGAGNQATNIEKELEGFSVCIDDCQKACCLGCKATKGDIRCIVLDDGSMPCCVENGSDMH